MFSKGWFDVKKLLGALLTLAMICTLGFGTVGCGKDKKTGSPTVTVTATVTPTPGGGVTATPTITVTPSPTRP